MKRHATKVVLNPIYIKKLRMDFLKLMKNAKLIDTPERALEWRTLMTRWDNQFGVLIMKYIPEVIHDVPLQHPRITRDEAKGWDRYVRSGCWDLYINAAVPMENPTDYWSLEERFYQFKKELKTWKGRVERGARKAWKVLEAFVGWYKGVTQSEPVLDVPVDERVNIEGFSVLMRGYKPSYADELERFKVGLKHYRARAQKVLPLLLRLQLPLVLNFKVRLSEGFAGQYHRNNFIEINTISSETNFGRMAQILAHEMGHHIYQTYLSKDAQDFWGRMISGNYGTLDLRSVLKEWGAEHDFYENKRIRQQDPILYLQIQGLFESGKDTFLPRAGKSIFFMDDVRDFLAKGGNPTWQVHKKPITGYAHKNAEEAFCEALGMLVGYGPQAVLPEVRQWLKIILPSIKVASVNNLAISFGEYEALRKVSMSLPEKAEVLSPLRREAGRDPFVEGKKNLARWLKPRLAEINRLYGDLKLDRGDLKKRFFSSVGIYDQINLTDPFLDDLSKDLRSIRETLRKLDHTAFMLNFKLGKT